MTTPSDPASSNNQPAPAPAAEVTPAAAVAAAAPAAAAPAAPAPAPAPAPTPAPASAAQPAAPEKYEAFKVPEGVTLDKPVVEVFEGVAKELGLPQDKAQALIDKVAPAMKAQETAAFEAMKATLLTAAKADAEIGGDKFDESVATARLALDAYFAPPFVKFLNESGLGNHPEMIRGLRKAAASLKQDNVVRGGDSHGEVDAKAFYNKSNMNA